jgi:NAD(P)-dependent dehydrogenase (short-subunit alcohol dehydrogenase family)
VHKGISCGPTCSTLIIQGAKRAEELRGRGLHVDFLRLDVTREEHVRAVSSEVIRELGNVDLLVNNAGVCVRVSD